MCSSTQLKSNFFSRSKVFFLSLVALGVMNSFAQNTISVPFSNGFVGINTANNVSASSYYLTSLGWSNVQFSQNSPQFVFVAQGNDIPGSVLITDNSGVEFSIPGFIKWRAPSGNDITTPVFVPTSGATLATNSSNGSATYTIATTSYIGLTFNGQSLIIPTTSSGGTTAGEVTGNAATSGILDALNAYLGSFPVISMLDYSVIENVGTKVITVTLSTTSAQTITVNFTTTNNTAISGTDYNAQTGSISFAPGQTSKTITLTILDDLVSESTETFYVQLTDPVNASILDAQAVITITDNDSVSLTATTSQTNVSCNGGSNATATVVASGGTPSYTYSWAPSGGTSATATGLLAGSYTCTITDANSVAIVKTFTITQPTAISVTPASQTNVACNGGATGAATINTPTGGAGGYTYNWTPGNPTGDGTTSVTGLIAGTWTCTIMDANSCSTSQTFTITQPTAISVTPASQTNVACNGGATGAATINTPTGGAGGYTYNWTPGNPTGDGTTSVTGLIAGTWTCTIMDANSCSTSQTFTITQPTAISVTPASQTNVACNGGATGAATINTPTGGAGGYTYNWTPGNPTGDGTTSVTGLIAGTWTCTIMDANSCSTSQTFTITQPTAISVTPASQTNVACNGGATGAATINTPTGGAGGYTYNWTPGNPTGDGTTSVTGLIAGTWTCTIMDANSCSTSQTFTITQPSAVLSATLSQTNVSCNGGANGTATVVASGGTPSYTYSWAPSGGTSATAIGLLAGVYTCTITDANSCMATQTFTITQPSAVLSATPSQTNVSCNGGANGTATVVASGGTPSYTYSWAPSGGTSATAIGLLAGVYTCTITDANSCMATQTFTITQPSAVLSATPSQTNVSCNGGANGTATVVASGGTPSYTYSWAPSGGTSATATGLLAGVYTCTITDANSCMATQTFTITQPSAVLSATPSQTNVSCNGGANGTATVVASGGTPSYTYSWAPSGGTSATAIGLLAGVYTCTITDANSCMATQTFTITQPSAVLSATPSQTNVSCNGGANGTATVVASGGTPSYTYSWAPSGGTSATATGLLAGVYTCTITDANSCMATQTFTITQPSAVLSATPSQTNVSCNGGANGTATVVASGGTPSYTYSWAPSGGTSATATGLLAGVYTCTITDANSCMATQTFTITQPSAVLSATPSQTNVSCNGGANGTATVVASGGTPSYTYSWAPSGGTSATAIGLLAGVYTCTITDANSCMATQTFTITQPSAVLSATPSQTNVSCNGGANGTATVVASGGTPSYTYSWAPSGGTSATATGLLAGVYTCTITDANSCMATQTFTITQPSIVSAPTAVSNQQFCYLNNPTVLNLATTSGIGINWYLTPSGGTPLSTATALITATTYYASQTVTSCESPTRVPVSVLLTCPVDAITDTFGPINGYTGSTTASVLTNDTLNGVAVIPSQVVLTGVTVPTGLALNANGTITIAPLTPAGTYTVTYQICEVLNPTNCDTATVTVTVSAAVIDAVADAFGPINGYTGSTTASVLTNDTLNGVAVIPSQVLLTGVTVPTGLTLNANGTITIAPLTPAGTYTVTYQICEVLNPTNCDTATATVTVSAAVIDAVTDPFGPINGYTGSTTASVLTNDTLNGVAVIPSQVVLTGVTVPTGLTLNANGTITIAPLTPAGTYTVTYQICEVLNPTNCDTATVTVTVSAAAIDAITDAFGPINGYTGSTTASVLTNDTLNGVAVIPSQVVLTGVTVPTGLTLNANGTITIAPLTPAGTYTVTYQICEVLNPTNCDTATATVTVSAAVIDAITDAFGPINGYIGSTTVSVLTNDTLNGVAVIPSQVVLTGVTVPTGLTLNANGTITIAPLTPTGTYTVTYQICEVLNPTNCDTATATVTVSAAAIDAITDTFGPINGYTGSTTASVLTNDTLNGVAVIPSQVVLTGVTVPTGLALNANGTITIAPLTPAGTYTVTYQICEVLNPTNCDTATVTVTVSAAVIDAVADAFGPINGYTGSTTASVLTNDTLNGVAVIPSQVLLTGVTVPTGLTLNANGTITIAPLTPAGTYTVTYQICEVLNPTNCDTVTATVTVGGCLDFAVNDCDNDGESNGTETTNGTDPNNPCSYTLAPATTSTAYATWSVLDCDGDGTPNGSDLNPKDPCIHAVGATPIFTNPIWAAADCDNDGESNGTETTNGTDPNNPCSYTIAPATTSTAYATWSVLDCDGDGTPNGSDLNPKDPCIHAVGATPIFTNPIWAAADCDNDGESNGTETTNGTDPNNPCSYTIAPATTSTAYAAWAELDCDGDGVVNGTEIEDGTDESNPCESISGHGTFPLSESFLEGDCDDDGLTNGEEIGLDPTKPNDSNNNGISDYLEVNSNTESEDDLEIFNAVTPDGNGENEVFAIRNIELYPNNTLTIFNRWGIVVYEADGYGQNNTYFRGVSEGRTTIKQSEELPIGTYFYVLRYLNSNGISKQRSGYLYLNK